MMIDLTNTELLLDLTTIEYENSFFDLHNDYNCTNINYKLTNKTISLLFEHRTPELMKKDLCLLFEEATITSFNVNLKRNADSCTLDLFYRGRYDIDDNIFENSPHGEAVFYIEFLEGDSFIIFSKKVTFTF